MIPHGIMPHPWWRFWQIGDFLVMLAIVVVFVGLVRRSDARARAEEREASRGDAADGGRNAQHNDQHNDQRAAEPPAEPAAEHSAEGSTQPAAEHDPATAGTHQQARNPGGADPRS